MEGEGNKANAGKGGSVCCNLIWCVFFFVMWGVNKDDYKDGAKNGPGITLPIGPGGTPVFIELCNKSDDLPSWYMASGIILAIMTVATCAMPTQNPGEEVGGKGKAMAAIGGCASCAYFGIWIWGNVVVWGSNEQCGTLRDVGRVLLIVQYSLFGLLCCCGCCFAVVLQKKHGAIKLGDGGDQYQGGIMSEA